MSEGYIDAGKLEIEVVADTKGFGKALKAKVEAEAEKVSAPVKAEPDVTGFRKKLREKVTEAAKGVNAKVGVLVDSTGLRAQLQTRVKAAATGVTAHVGVAIDEKAVGVKVRAAIKAVGTPTIPVKFDTKKMRAELRAAVTAAQAGLSVNLPVGGGPSDTDRLSEAKTRLTRRLVEARTATLDLHAAQQKLADLETRSGKNTEEYRRALVRVTNAEDKRGDAVRRTQEAMKALRGVSTPSSAADVLRRTTAAQGDLDRQTAPRTFTGTDDPKFVDRLAEARRRLTRAEGQARKATDSLHDARQKLSDVERKHGKDSDEYRRALGSLTQAQNHHNDSLRRAWQAVTDLRDVDSRGGSRKVTVETELRTAQARAELLRFLRPREIDVKTKLKTSKSDEIEKVFGKWAKKAGSALGALIVPSVIALISGAAISLTGLVGALGAVVAAVGPAVGTIGLLPAVLGGVGLAVAPLIMGFGGLGDAMKAIASGDAKKLQAAMKDLSPAARQLVFQIALIRPAWAALRKEVQSDVLRGVGFDVRRLSDNYLPKLREALRDIAQSWNFAFRETAATFNQTNNLTDMGLGFRSIAKAGRDLSEVTSNMAQAFIDLFYTGTPFVHRMTDAIQHWILAFTAMIHRTRESGELAAFFERAVDRATLLGRIIRDLSIGIYHFFAAGSESGGEMLTTLDQVAARFRAVTGTPEKQAQFKKFFEDSRLIAAGLGAAIGYISQKLAELGHLFNKLPDNVKGMIGPMLLVGGAVGFVLGKVGALFGLLSAGVSGITALLGLLGVSAATVATGIAIALGVIAALVAAVAVVAAGIAYAWHVSDKFKEAVRTAFSTLTGIVGDAWRTVRPIFHEFGRIWDDTVAPAIKRAIDLWSERMIPAFKSIRETYDKDVKPALQDLVKAFRDAEPQIRTAARWLGEFVVWLAKAAGSSDAQVLVAMFKAFAFVVKLAIDGVINFIHFFQWAVNSIQAFPDRVRAAWAGITGFFAALWATIVARFNAGLDFFKSLPGRIGTTLAGLRDAVAAKFAQMWEGAKEWSQHGIHDIVAFVAGLPLRMLAALINGAAMMIVWARNMWSGIQAAFTWGVNNATAFVQQFPGKVRRAVNSMLDTLGAWAVDVWNGVKKWFTWGVNNATAEVQQFPGRVQRAVNGLLDSIGRWASDLWNGVKARFSSGVDDAVGTVTGLHHRVVDILTRIIGAARNITNQIITGIRDGLREGIDKVREAAAHLAAVLPEPIKNVIGRFVEGGRAIVEWARALPGRIIDAVSPLVGRVTGWASQVWATIRGAFSGGISGVVGLVTSLPGRIVGAVSGLGGQLRSWASSALAGVRNAFSSGVTAIGTAWNRVLEVAKTPVRFVVNTVMGGLATGFNTIGGKFGIKVGVPHVGFAEGGIMPGYTPGRDVHRFTSPTGGVLDLSGGEPVLRPEVGRVVGPEWVSGVNAAAKRGGVGGVRKYLGGYADGGILPGGRYLGGFAGGGVVGDIGSWIAGKARDAASFVVGNMASFATPLVNKLRGLLDSLPGEPNAFKDAVRRAPGDLLDKFLSWVKGKDAAAAKVGLGGGVGATTGGLGGGPLAAWMAAGMRIAGVPASWAGPLRTLIMRESGGNPRSINLWDSNARAGHPSQGLMQTIPGTFARYRDRSLANDIYDPVANIVAGLRYILARYGSIFNVQQAVGATPRGYDSGGDLAPGVTLVRNDTGRPEAVFTQGMLNAILGRLDALARAIERSLGAISRSLRTGGALDQVGQFASTLQLSPGLVPVGAGLVGSPVPRGTLTGSLPGRTGAAGTTLTQHIYPAAKQSEREIAVIAAREVVWGMTPS